METQEKTEVEAPYLTVKEVAQMYGVTLQAVYRAIEGERLASEKVLGKTAIPRAAALAFKPAGHGGVREGSGNRRDKRNKENENAND